MSDFGYFLYGFFKEEEKKLSLFIGMDGIHPLEVVHSDDSTSLSCVVSKVPLDEFGEGKLQENLQDIKWLEKYVRAYDEITRKLFEQTTFIPIRFGTIYLTKERLEECIKVYKDQVLQLVETLNGKIELGVKFYIDRKKLQDKLLTIDSGVQNLHTKIQGESPGKAHFLKKKLETLSDEKVETWVSDVSHLLTKSLKGISSNTQLLNLQPKEGTNKMFLNVACLLSSSKLEGFKEMVKNVISQEKLDCIECEITGPWPPYSFVRLESEKQEKEFLDV